MTSFFQRYVRKSNDAWVLNADPAYVLERLRGEAIALHAARPQNRWILDQACIVIGYVEAYHAYGENEFPWDHIVAKLCNIRRIIARAEHLSKRLTKKRLSPAH